MSTYATRDDEHVMRILSGATFGPNARVTLPSGKVMSSDEMTWNAEADGPPSPPHSENDS